MIARLRRRMTLLVVAVVLAVTAGIIFSINYMNWRHIVSQAEEALDILAENKGARPGIKINAEGDPPEGSPADGPSKFAELPGSEAETMTGPPEKPENPGGGMQPEQFDGSPSPRQAPDGGPGGMMRPGQQPPETENTVASLSNYYVATLTSEGEVEDWKSDRSDLYSDEMVKEIVESEEDNE